MSPTHDSVTTIVSLCGGGIPAVHYCTGILYSLYKCGELLEDIDGKQVINSNLVITASSGGTVPLMLLHFVLTNELHHTRADWFEHYIINTVNLIHPILMIELFGTSLLKSISICSKITELTRMCSENLRNLVGRVIPSEIMKGKSIHFIEDSIHSQFKYNYVIDSELYDSPVVSNDFTHLNSFDPITQICELIVMCCVPISLSQVKVGIINDAALLIDNDILDLQKFKNLKVIDYYTLRAYDAKTNNSYSDALFLIKRFTDRAFRIFNYRAINNIKKYIDTLNLNNPMNQVTFNLVTFPNKFDPVCKYNNKIYRDVVPYIFYQDDFRNDALSIPGILNGDSRMLQLIFLVGAFETFYLRKVNEETVKIFIDDLPTIYKEVLDNPYYIYFKTDPLSVLSRFVSALF